jgi:hypothetical protein
MFYDDHAPPHFHAIYGKDQVTIEIQTLLVRRGHLPQRAIALVLEWAANHRQELTANWELAQRHSRLNQIAPLE